MFYTITCLIWFYIAVYKDFLLNIFQTFLYFWKWKIIPFNYNYNRIYVSYFRIILNTIYNVYKREKKICLVLSVSQFKYIFDWENFKIISRILQSSECTTRSAQTLLNYSAVMFSQAASNLRFKFLITKRGRVSRRRPSYGSAASTGMFALFLEELERTR